MSGSTDPRTGLEVAAPGLLHHADGWDRCAWCGSDPDYVAYHDHEWGRPVHDEQPLFEKLCLEAFQAGLSWLTILRKRPAFRSAFAGFAPEVVAGFATADVERLISEPAIVRNRAKIEATVANARALCRLHEHGGTLANLVWAAAPPPRPRPIEPVDVPARTEASAGLATVLKRHGFRFVGATTAYALMQAMGLVDDHLDGCSVPTEVTGPPSGDPWGRD